MTVGTGPDPRLAGVLQGVARGPMTRGPRNMEHFPVVLPGGPQNPRHPNMERFPVVRPDPDPRFQIQQPGQRLQAPQPPPQRISPGVYRAADGSLVNQQGRPFPNQPQRHPLPPQQQMPNPYARDMLGGQYRPDRIQDGLGRYGGQVSGPFNAPWQGAPGMYQPPPQNVSIGHGMQMPIPQPGVPYPYARDMLGGQYRPDLIQDGLGRSGGQQSGPITAPWQGAPTAGQAAANYYRR